MSKRFDLGQRNRKLLATLETLQFPGLTRSGWKNYFPGMDHSPGFLKIVNEARGQVKEITLPEVRARLSKNSGAILLDVREDSEWQAGHAAEAAHLGRGILERDLETKFPNPTTEILMYCGGGYRSILAVDAAQRMGYKNVFSVIGGYKGMVQAGWPMKI